MMASKALGVAESDTVRAHLKRVVDRDFGGNQSGAADKLGVSQGFISEVLSGKRGAGRKLIDSLCSYEGLSYEQAVGRAPVARVVELDARYPNRSRGIRAAMELIEGLAFDRADRLAPRALQSKEDPSPEWWYQQIKAAHERELKGLSLGISEVEDDD